MASAVVYEKFWTSKSACCEAERRHYESLAKYPVVMDDVKKVTEEAPAPAPQKDKREKPSRRRRRNKGSASHSESSNRADSVSESPIESRDDKVEVPPSPVKTPAEPRIEPQIVKEQKENKNDKGNKREENVTKKDTEKIVDNEANLNKEGNNQVGGKRSLASEVAEARQHIKKSLECMDSVLASMPNVDVTNKLNNVVNEVSQISVALNDLRSLVMSLKKDVEQLKSQKSRQTSESKPGASQPAKPAPAPTAKEDTDDGVDLFASDSDDEEAAKIKEERLAAYAAKKAKKPALIAKSSIILDVKPWDDETDMGAMEKEVRKITSDGLLWGASKLVPLAYGIKKLQINCVVEDEKISIDWLQEEIEGITELVQSCDIAAFNKI